jgi:hypothetical protein
VRQPTEEDPSFILITDASKEGWGAILVCTKSGQTSVMGRKWPLWMNDYVNSSSRAEPLAVVAAVNTFFDEGTRCAVLHVSDSVTTISAINKGYSTHAAHFVGPYLAERYPGISFRSTFCPGEDMPADGPSRGRQVDIDKLDRLATQLKFTRREIREVGQIG